MFNDQEVNALIARANFYEACVNQLRQDLPTYLAKQSKITNSTHLLKKALRNVASNEPETKLQNCLFLYASKHEELEKERLVFEKCEKKVMSPTSIYKSGISPILTLNHRKRERVAPGGE